MTRIVALVALLAAVASASTLPKGTLGRSQLSPRLSGKIINGAKTTIEKNPHQVSVQYNNTHFCGGSIISKHWVLTAAHCLFLEPNFYSILAGTADKENEEHTGSVHSVDNIVVHPDFDYDAYESLMNDVGLVHVLEPFEFDETHQPIELFNENEETHAGSLSIITGWGRTETGYPQYLNLVEIPIISKAECADNYKYRGGLYDGQICAAYPEGGKDACEGDSGGPLTIDGRLAGIVSWGEGCAKPGQPGVYTEIAYFRDWIKSNSGV